MYSEIFHVANIVFYICLGISILLLMQRIVYHIYGLLPPKKFPEAKKNHKYAILIPARNESRVIEGILNSIKDQDYDHSLLDTYVIVEREDDPTCAIAKRYPNTHVFVRQHLELKGKGHALEEVVREIFQSGKTYEAFFVCDADNILSKNFISEMNKCYDAGYDVAVGYRNSKNWNDGWIASNSAITFSMINTFQNKARARINEKVVLSGTGFYVASRVLEDIGGWKFFELTEDIEFSMHCIVSDLKCTYNENAVFLDEQPVKLKASWNQRLRWVKGYRTVQRKYHAKFFKGMMQDQESRLTKYEYFVNIFPIVCVLVTTIVYAAFNLVLGIICSAHSSPFAINFWVAFAATSGSLYLFFVLYAALMLFAERRHSNITVWNALVCCIMFPIFSAMYVPIVFQSMLKKEVEWKPIAHTHAVENTAAQESKLARTLQQLKNEENHGILKSSHIMKPFLTHNQSEEMYACSQESVNFGEVLA